MHAPVQSDQVTAGGARLWGGSVIRTVTGV